jgi:predicted PurR-regulated permease PerM
VAALGVVIIWTLYLARGVLLLIYVSVLLAIGFGPIVQAIEHQQVVPVGKRLPRWLAILAVYLLIVGALTVVGLLVIPPLVTQARALWTALPGLIDQGQTFLIRYGLLDHRITLEEALRRAPASGDAVGTVAMAATNVVQGVFALLTVLILTFYLLVESDSLFRGFARLFPRADRPRVQEAAEQISVKVSAWLSGQLFLAAVIGVSAAIGLYALGVPYFYVLALVAALGEMIPVVGPVLAAIPGVAVGFTVSPQTGLFVLIFFLAQQQVENHFLVPKIMSRQVGVSAVTVIIALLIGGSVLGILGAVLAVPSAAILQVVIQELLDERDRLDERSKGIS